MNASCQPCKLPPFRCCYLHPEDKKCTVYQLHTCVSAYSMPKSRAFQHAPGNMVACVLCLQEKGCQQRMRGSERLSSASTLVPCLPSTVAEGPSCTPAASMSSRSYRSGQVSSRLTASAGQRSGTVDAPSQEQQPWPSILITKASTSEVEAFCSAHLLA